MLQGFGGNGVHNGLFSDLANLNLAADVVLHAILANVVISILCLPSRFEVLVFVANFTGKSDFSHPLLETLEVSLQPVFRDVVFNED